jgi:membrane associated rhomboid family serine protease
VQRAAYEGTGALVTRALIALNVLVYLATVANGGSINSDRGTIYERGVLYGPSVADGDYWRLLTSAFMHYGPMHLGMNMLVLWFVGAPLEERLGRGRYVSLYLVAGLVGAAGALLFTPCAATVGASGAIFGLFGAALVLERQGIFVYGGSIVGLVVLNFVFTLVFANQISIGGHLGGFVGGILAMLALSRLGRTHAVYGRVGVRGYGALVLIAAASVVLAIWVAGRGCSPLL